MYAGAGCRNPRSSRYRLMPGNNDFPGHWNQQISTQQPDGHQASQDSDDEWDRPSKVHVFGARSVIADSREKGIQGVQEVAGVQGGDPGPEGPVSVAMHLGVALYRAFL